MEDFLTEIPRSSNCRVSTLDGASVSKHCPLCVFGNGITSRIEEVLEIIAKVFALVLVLELHLNYLFIIYLFILSTRNFQYRLLIFHHILPLLNTCPQKWL